MANDTVIPFIGNLTADPELRWTPNGTAVANFTLASTPRHYDKQAGEWKDEEAIFMRCTAWREHAESIAESLTKGMRVIAVGRLKAQSYETKDGAKRTAWELQVDSAGPDLKYATAKVTKTPKPGEAPSAPQQPSAQPAADPWGNHQGGWGGAPSGDAWGTPQQQTEPPF